MNETQYGASSQTGRWYVAGSGSTIRPAAGYPASSGIERQKRVVGGDDDRHQGIASGSGVARTGCCRDLGAPLGRGRPRRLAAM
jgi:hypothetical protein